MAEELEILEEDPKVEIHLNSLKARLKNIVNWKNPSIDGV